MTNCIYEAALKSSHVEKQKKRPNESLKLINRWLWCKLNLDVDEKTNKMFAFLSHQWNSIALWASLAIKSLDIREGKSVAKCSFNSKAINLINVNWDIRAQTIPLILIGKPVHA